MARCAAHRLVTTIAVVVSLLFAQLALAGYVCPAPLDAPPAMDMDMASGAPCHGTDTQPQAPSPALCHHHCTNAAQSFEPAKIPVASLPAIVQVLVVPLHIDASQRDAVAFATKSEAQPPPAPVFLATLRLRV